MTWFKVDDQLHDHKKARRLGKDKVPALGVWVLCGSWSADTLSDGFVPDEIVQRFDPKMAYAKRLVEVGLWHRVEHDGEPGYQFHDWSEYQPTREKVLGERQAWRDRKQKSRDKSREGSRGDTHEDSSKESREESNSESQRPVPFPVPVPSLVVDLGGGSYVPARASAPPSKCLKHQNSPTTQPCRPCGDARKAHEAWESERRAEVRACRLCTTDGQRLVPGSRATPMSPYVRCDHQPLPRQEPA